MHLVYREFLPSPAWADYLAGHWKFVVPMDWGQTFEHIAPPDGCVSLFLCKNERHHFQFAGLMGPQLTMLKTTLVPGSVYWGIRFYPGAFSCCFDQSVEDLKNQSIVLPDFAAFDAGLAVLNPDFADVQLIETLLPHPQKTLDTEVRKVVQSILKTEGQCKIADLVHAAFLSERQLQKRFRKAVGLSMKELARVMRIRAALVQMVLHERQSIDISFEQGFYDQAHFLHEFQQFARQQPEEVKRYLRNIQHYDVHWAVK